MLSKFISSFVCAPRNLTWRSSIRSNFCTWKIAESTWAPFCLQNIVKNYLTGVLFADCYERWSPCRHSPGVWQATVINTSFVVIIILQVTNGSCCNVSWLLWFCLCTCRPYVVGYVYWTPIPIVFHYYSNCLILIDFLDTLSNTEPRILKSVSLCIGLMYHNQHFVR